jgi:hypothetical protein
VYLRRCTDHPPPGTGDDRGDADYHQHDHDDLSTRHDDYDNNGSAGNHHHIDHDDDGCPTANGGLRR